MYYYSLSSFVVFCKQKDIENRKMDDHRSENLFANRMVLSLVWAVVITSHCVGCHLLEDSTSLVTHDQDSIMDGVDDIIEETDEQDQSQPSHDNSSGSSPTQRQYYNPSIMDGKNCDRKSEKVIVHISEGHKVNRKYFKGCILVYGEQAMISNRMDVPVSIRCTRQKSHKEMQLEAAENTQFRWNSENQSKETDNATVHVNATEFLSGVIRQDYVFVMNAYVDPEDDYDRDHPKWICNIERVNRAMYGSRDRITFDVFADYTKKESFRYDITTNGVYEANPRLVKNWTGFSSFPKRLSGHNVNISSLFPRSPGDDFL